MSDQDKNSSLSALIAGVVIGAGVTYLFTTKEGRKLKDKLVVEGTKMLDKIKEGLEEAGEEIEEKKEVIQEKVAEQIDLVKENVEDMVSEVPKHIEQVQKKGRRFFFKKHPSTPES